MSYIDLQILNKYGDVLKKVSGHDEVNLIYNGEYQEGDQIILEVEELETLYYIQFDDAKGKSLVYLTGKVVYTIPLVEKRINTSPKVFAGNRHLLWGFWHNGGSLAP